MAKRGQLQAPFELQDGATFQWQLLNREFPGHTMRGQGLTPHQIWQLALAAELQFFRLRGTINEVERADLARYRRNAGLPAEPPPAPADLAHWSRRPSRRFRPALA